MTVVLLPDEFGDLAICDLDMLNEALKEGDTLDDAVERASFDSLNPRAAERTVRAHLTRIRNLNASDDGAAYWGFDK